MLAETSISTRWIVKTEGYPSWWIFIKKGGTVFIKKENPEAPREERLGRKMYQLSWHNHNNYNTFVQEVDNFLRHWNVKADLPRMELTHCCSKTSIYAIFACTIIRSNTGYRLVISIFCRCRSGPNFPFTTASDTFPSSLNVRSKSLNLCTFEISLWNCDFCRPKARFYVTRLVHFGPPSWNFLFTVPRFLAAPAKLR